MKLESRLVQKHNDKTDRKEWALVAKKSDRVLKWFGTSKPSEEAVKKEERRVQYFKHLHSVIDLETLDSAGFDPKADLPIATPPYYKFHAAYPMLAKVLSSTSVQTSAIFKRFYNNSGVSNFKKHLAGEVGDAYQQAGSRIAAASDPWLEFQKELKLRGYEITSNDSQTTESRYISIKNPSVEVRWSTHSKYGTWTNTRSHSKLKWEFSPASKPEMASKFSSALKSLDVAAGRISAQTDVVDPRYLKDPMDFTDYSYLIPDFGGVSHGATDANTHERFRHFNQKLFNNELPSIRIDIVNHTNSRWLGQFTHSWKKNRRTGEVLESLLKIEIQKQVLGHPETLDRVLVHEMVHLWQQVNGTGSDSHGGSFKEKANEINAIMGKDFVTEKSDESYDKTQKPFFLVIWPDSQVPSGWLFGYVPKPMRSVHKEYIGKREGARYIETQDSKWLTKKPLGSTGGYMKRSPEDLKELQDLYKNATSFPRPLKLSDFKKSSSNIMDERFLEPNTTYRKGVWTPVDQQYGWGMGGRIVRSKP